ncbi:MAG: DUF4363 family protein [Oscillospiraceae bacterium]|nr:DUF4363 family protein [Oscillospiraceae bacterium]
MKRLILSFALLAALAGFGAWNTGRIDESCQRTCSLLRQAQERGESDDWAGAEALTRAAWAEWDGRSTYLYTVLCHDCTDEIYTEFHELMELIEWGENPEYAAASSRLIAQLEHLSEAERLNLENLL